MDHPVLGEGGLERGEFLGGGPPPDALVGGDRTTVGGHRDDLVLERAAVTTVIVPSKNFDRSSPLTDVQVNGQRARGELNGSVVKFRKQTGDWKFCMTG